MTAYALKTRRMILRDMGKAGLAVLVLGTTACATDSSPDEETTSSSSGDGGSDTTVTPSSTSGTTQPAATRFDHQRVDLGFVSAYVLYRSGEAALIDTGVSDSEAAIETALAEIGLGWDAVAHVMVTHKHPDHQGSLEAVLAQAPAATWYAGAGDISAIRASTDGVVVGDGESIFDLQVVETPGHTPGHISVLDPVGGILVAGDALNGASGGVVGANPDFSEDMQLANASVQKLASFDYDVILFGHGEPVLENGSSAVVDLAASIG
jgi:glyoxylase-like metal-dependent hydrolase (beta-lactamase superfamily II)